jgi:HSP20 family protein
MFLVQDLLVNVKLKKELKMESINKNLMKQLAHQFDLMNTINGGVSMTLVNIKDQEDKREIKISAPGVRVESFNLYLNNNQLMVFSVLPQEVQENYLPVAIPMFSRTFTLPPYVDDENIEAIYEDEVLRIILPFKNDSKPHIRKIDIKYDF